MVFAEGKNGGAKQFMMEVEVRRERWSRLGFCPEMCVSIN